MSKRTVWFLIIFLGAAAPLIFFASDTASPSTKLLAQVGVVVGIAPNPYNTLADQLQQEQTELDKQKADLAARQAAFASSTASTTATASPSVRYLSIVVTTLGLLVCLNFYLDWRRSRRITAPSVSE